MITLTVMIQQLQVYILSINLPIINLLVGSVAKFLSAVAADLTTVS